MDFEKRMNHLAGVVMGKIYAASGALMAVFCVALEAATGCLGEQAKAGVITGTLYGVMGLAFMAWSMFRLSRMKGNT